MPPKRRGPGGPVRGGSEPNRAAKVRHVEKDPIREKVNSIIVALETHHQDDDIQRLLVDAAKSAFDEPKDKRHRFHSTFINMIDDTLQKFVKEFEGSVANNQARINNADSVKAENIEKRDALADALEKKRELIQEKEKELAEKMELTKSTNREAKVKKAETAKATAVTDVLEAELADAQEKHSVFLKLRDEPSEKEKDRKKQVSIISPYLKKMKVDSSLIVSAPIALQKETRGNFDNAVVGEIAIQFDAHISKLQEGIATEQVSNQSIIQAQEAADAYASQAHEAEIQALGELQNLENEQSDLEEQKKVVDRDIKNHDKNVKKIIDDLADSTETFEHLTIVYNGMTQMRDRVTETEKIEAED